MGNNKSSAMRRYVRQVRSLLPCPAKQKQMIVEDIWENAAVFLQEHPAADYSQIEAHFGTPEQLAVSYVKDMDTGKLLRELRLKKRIMTVIVSSLVIALFIWAAAIIFIVADTHKYNDSYYGGYFTDASEQTYQELITC